MSSAIARLLLLVCAALAVVPATAGAATKSSVPKVKSVAPMKLKVGDRLTIKGSGFLKGKNRNTVVFKASGQRAVFVKAESATTSKIVIKVPTKLLSFFKVKGGDAVATRFQLRVLARKLSKAYTSTKGSPVISPVATSSPSTPAKKSSGSSGSSSSSAASGGSTSAGGPAAAADCEGDGTSDAVDTDDDNDLLLDSTEAAIGTGVCVADTDGDGLTDGWEYKSAVDFNQRNCPNSTDYPIPCAAAYPYPKKFGYPNPRNADAGTDYDGDSMTAGEEFTAWQRKAAADASWNNVGNLWYSGGLQASQDTSAAAPCVGMVVPEPFNGKEDYPEFDRSAPPFVPSYLPDGAFTGSEYDVYSLDSVGRHAYDGCLDDAERDEDGDFLTNFDEAHGGMTRRTWWGSVYGEALYKETFTGTDWLDADSDGDGVVDGLDDQDGDDFLNVEELNRGPKSNSSTGARADRAGLWVDPFNPCLPAINSASCPPSLLLDSDAWMPFYKDGETPPVERWPLYEESYHANSFGAELWDGLLPADQELPALHPLPRP